jgi:hypothetical protein
MKYMLMIYADEVARAKTMTQADIDQEMADYYAFSATAAARTPIASSEALHNIDSATTVRVRDGKTITTDGPFAETKEQLGGFYVLDCKDLDEAIEMASLIPSAKHGSVEIRPVVIFE